MPIYLAATETRFAECLTVKEDPARALPPGCMHSNGGTYTMNHTTNKGAGMCSLTEEQNAVHVQRRDR